MKRTQIARRTATSVAAGVVGILMLAAPVSAQTYSDGQGNSTGSGSDTGTGGSSTGDSGTGSGGTTGGGGTTGTGSNPGTTTDGGGSDDAPFGQVDDDLAFTGADTRSLVIIGGGVIGLGAAFVVATKRRDSELTAVKA